MARKTNKTSHVLDLLMGGSQAEAPAPAPAPSPDIQPYTPAKVTVVDEGSSNDRLSQEIMANLSMALEEEAPAQPAQTPVAPPQAAAEPVEPPAPAMAVAPAEELENPLQALQAMEVPEYVPEETFEIPQDEGTAGNEEKEPEGDGFHFHFINVMEELLLRLNMREIMGKYNVCTCARCIADVRALTLTSLPAKYVVTEENSFSPVINYYENRYKTGMLTELVKACTFVRDRPHHARK